MNLESSEKAEKVFKKYGDKNFVTPYIIDYFESKDSYLMFRLSTGVYLSGEIIFGVTCLTDEGNYLSIWSRAFHKFSEATTYLSEMVEKEYRPKLRDIEKEVEDVQGR